MNLNGNTLACKNQGYCTILLIICKPKALFQLKNTTRRPFNKHAHKRTFNRYSKVPRITEPEEELFTLKKTYLIRKINGSHQRNGDEGQADKEAHQRRSSS